MATVKFTDKLKDQVKKVIEHSYNTRRKNLLTEIEQNKPSPDDFVKYYIEITGGTELYEKCLHWLPEINHMWPTFRDPATGISVSFSYYGVQNPKLPDSIRNAVVEPPDTVPFHVQATNELIKNAIAARVKLQQLDEEIGSVTTQVVNAFRAYPSVNAAVKAHPELEHMLPQEAKTKMAEKVVRTKAEAPNVEVDKNKLLSVAVMARLGG